MLIYIKYINKLNICCNLKQCIKYNYDSIINVNIYQI